MTSGLIFAIAACFCWSLVFIVPSFITGFNPLEIALGRFFVYGLLCFCYLLLKKRNLFSSMYLNYWKTAFILSFFSTVLCYTAVVLNVQYAGPTLATLIFSMTPITIPLAGNFYKKEVSFYKFIIPLSLTILGIFLAKFHSLEKNPPSLILYSFGIFSGLIGVASWTFFSVINADFLKKNKDLSLTNWFLMLGSSTFFLVLLLSAISFPFLTNPEKYFTYSPDLHSFLGFSLLLGTVSTALPFYFWMQGSKRLPISLAGQLMVFEIIFALVLIYCLHGKAFSFAEISGILLMIMGVFVGFKTLNRKVKEL